MLRFAPLVFSFLASTYATTLLRRGGVDEEKTSSRRLDFERFGLGFEPESQVTDHLAIDLDQASIETALGIGTIESFESAKAIYERGGHSRSFASVRLQGPLTSNIARNTIITGVDSNGKAVIGKAYYNLGIGETEIQVQYRTIDIQSNYVNCQVGALNLVGEENTKGCFAPRGRITIENHGEYRYSYSVLDDNLNGRTIAGFSTLAQAQMFEGCPGCPYLDFKKFYDYYGVFDYGNEWVVSALDGRRTAFVNGNADFGEYSLTGRAEAAKIGTAYMNVFMYAIREFYEAIEECKEGCMDCNDDPANSWDVGVAYYTGSTESFLMYTLANDRCDDFRTCGPEGNHTEGIAGLNYELTTEFSLGQYNLLSGNCNAARENAYRITQLMYVPLVQGALRYAYAVERQNGREREKAQGAAFAAAVLPILHHCDRQAAQIVYDNMRVGANNTSYLHVKTAFEKNYPCMGITCGHIGGLYNAAEGDYFEDVRVCVDSELLASASEHEEVDLLIIGVTVPIALIALLAIICGAQKMQKEADNRRQVSYA